MNTKYTPGPWTVHNGFDKYGKGAYFPSVILCKDKRIIVNNSHDQEAESLMANAYLIAAAPELLEACKMAQTQLMAYAFDMPERFKKSFNQGQKMLNDAIAKAEWR